MKITFDCYIDLDDSIDLHPVLPLQDRHRTFEIDWKDGCPIPSKGEIVSFDHLIEDLEAPWVPFFVEVCWAVDCVYWDWDSDLQTYLPTISMQYNS